MAQENHQYLHKVDQSYRDFLCRIAGEVDDWLDNSENMVFFQKQWEKFCTMVDTFREALQPYIKKLQEAKKQIEKENFAPLVLVHVCPPPKDWVKIKDKEKKYISLPDYVFDSLLYRPREPVNPLLWIDRWDNPSIQRSPSDDEKLMINFVFLAVLHNEIGWVSTYRKIYLDKPDHGKWFERNKFSKDLWIRLNQNEENKHRIQMALKHAKSVLPTAKPAEKEQNSIPAKIWAMLCNLYEITLKVIIDAVLDRIWPKPQ